ncbi:hypothetical protein GCM10010517_45210 [Streptosporangium fragile]|uniref:Gas vesicle protein n=1 Tax=Streptosporangium fragile TaxID=46186 RepID=A0ABN3W3G6_9ACTN
MSPDRTRGTELAAQGRIPPERVALVDLLDRLLAGGVVVTGDLVLSIADIDLVRISLRALITSVEAPDARRPVRGPDLPETVWAAGTSEAVWAPAPRDHGYPP